MNVSDDLDAWARRYRREPRPSSSPPANRGGNVAGSTRRGWSESGRKGVYPNGRGRYVAKVRHTGRLYYLGTYDTEDEAAKVSEAKLVELKGSGA